MNKQSQLLLVLIERNIFILILLILIAFFFVEENKFLYIVFKQIIKIKVINFKYKNSQNYHFILFIFFFKQQ